MKKLMITAAVVLAAVVAQAASIKWNASLTGVDTSALAGNGSIASGGAGLKGNSSLTYSLTLYLAGTETVAFEKAGNVAFATTKETTNVTFSDTTKIAQNTSYDYVFVLSGTEADLRNLGVKGEWDYSDATIASTLKGTLKTEAAGATTWTVAPSTWTVSGAVAVPEPTSGLLLILGVAGMALRRRRD